MEGGEDRDAQLAQLALTYRSRLPDLWRVAAAISGSREAAPDLVQEAFVRAVQRVESFRGEGPLEGWLWRIVVNVARNARREPLMAYLPEQPEVTPMATADRVVESEVAAALARLSERQRLVLFLRYYADLDYRTIAEALSISSGTVGATLTAARAALAQALELKEATS
jgi:RNA polymerase sigma-70 factor, ECF subfamily